MSANTEVINGAYEAFARADIPAVLDVVDDAADWEVTQVLPQGGSFQGKDAVGQFFQGLGQAWQDFNVDLADVLDAGDSVVAVGQAQGTLSGGSSASYGFAHVFTLSDGKISRFREYAAPDEALLADAAS